jgi:LPXTG-motif cell wall-anchored protein
MGKKHGLARRRAQKRRGLSGLKMKSSTPWLIGAGITALVLGALWYWRRQSAAAETQRAADAALSTYLRARAA